MIEGLSLSGVVSTYHDAVADEKAARSLYHMALSVYGKDSRELVIAGRAFVSCQEKTLKAFMALNNLEPAKG
jgi:hypothetical protein